MIERLFVNSETVDEYREGPIGPYVDTLADLLIDLGHPISDIQSRLHVLAALNRWMRRRRLVIGALNQVRIDEFLTSRRRKICHAYYRRNVLTVDLLIEHLRRIGVVPAKPVEATRMLTKMDRTIDAFVRFLGNERGLVPITQRHYSLLARSFLEWRDSVSPRAAHTIQGKEVYQFVFRYARKHSLKQTQTLTVTLRSFFGFLLSTGRIRSDLRPFVPVTQSPRRLSGIPLYLEPHEVQRVLNATNKKTAVGKRDYALLLILARYGLRACEIVRLKLDDLNWDDGEMTILGKGPRQSRFPITQDRRAGLNPASKGAHLLRHSAATQILRRGASLAEVGEVLRHRDMNTTAIYAKVDLPRLQTITRAWPQVQLAGGAR